MKSLMLIGALAGTFIGIVFSLAQENSWPTTLWHACAAAYLASLLMRWWGRAWRTSLTRSLEEKQNASDSAPLNPLHTIPKTART